MLLVSLIAQTATSNYMSSQWMIIGAIVLGGIGFIVLLLKVKSPE